MANPSLDLNAVLQPVVDNVRDLLFNATVSIQDRTDTQDSTGQSTPGSWADVEAGVLAIVEPVRVSTGTESLGAVIQAEDHVRILMSDEHTVPMSGRILVTAGQGAGDVWDVVGVQHDPARVTTEVIGRRVAPGAPA